MRVTNLVSPTVDHLATRMLTRGWWGRAPARSRLFAALFWEAVVVALFVSDLVALWDGTAGYWQWIGVVPAGFLVLLFAAQIIKALGDLKVS